MTEANQLVRQASEFFERYARSFDERDWPTFVALFHVPALSVRGDGAVALLATPDQAQSFFAQVSEAWRADGYARFAMSGLEVRPLGERSVLVTLTWHMQREDGSPLDEWQQSYQLLVGPQWQVLSSTFHAEPPAPPPAA